MRTLALIAHGVGPADYEVDFIDYFTRLTGSKLGAKFVPDPYVVDSVLDIPKL